MTDRRLRSRREWGMEFVGLPQAMSLCCDVWCVLGGGSPRGTFSSALAKLAPGLDGWRRGGVDDPAAVERLRCGLADLSGDRLYRRRPAFRRLGNLDARPQHRMGLRQTSAADGLGRAGLDLGL